MMMEYQPNWPPELREAAEQNERINLMILNLGERIKRADSYGEAEVLIDDLLFYREQQRKSCMALFELRYNWAHKNLARRNQNDAVDED